MAISWSIFSILVIINLSKNLKKEQKKKAKLELLTANLHQGLSKQTELVRRSNLITRSYAYNQIKDLSKDFIINDLSHPKNFYFFEKTYLNLDPETGNWIFRCTFTDREERIVHWNELNKSLWETERIDELTRIYRETEKISQTAQKISHYTGDYFRFIESNYFEEKSPEQIKTVNDCVKSSVRQSIEFYQNKFRERIHLKEIYDPRLQDSQVDNLTLQIVLEKLIENALQALEGKIERQQDFIPTITVQTQKLPDSLEISVTDNGRGIRKSEQSRIFEPFVAISFHKKEGIGLALVKGLLELEKGTIRVDSTPGEGSTFIIALKPKPLGLHRSCQI